MAFTGKTTTSEKADDRELLLRTHRGDEASARLLWEMHGPRLVRIAEGLCRGIGGPAQAMDVVQSVFCAVLRTPRSKLGQIDDVQAYLVRAVRNAALNARRAEQRQARREESAARASGADSVDQVTRQGLLDAMDRLEPDLRELVVMKHAGGLTIDEMALVLELARGTVADRYAAAMRSLRAMLSDRAPADAAREASGGAA